MQVPRLREVRERQLLTQDALARRARMSVATVNHVERGLRSARISTVRRLAEALGVPATALMAAVDEPAQNGEQR